MCIWPSIDSRFIHSSRAWWISIYARVWVLFTFYLNELHSFSPAENKAKSSLMTIQWLSLSKIHYMSCSAAAAL